MGQSNGGKSTQLAFPSGPLASTPALRGRDGWVKEPKDKAELFCQTLTAKFVVPPIVPNQYTAIPQVHPADQRLLVTDEMAGKALSNLRVSSATGPDGLPTRILQCMAGVLAEPVALLAQMILDQGCWPDSWRVHWIVMLHKRQSIYDPKNYRGVHLTAQLSKVVERILTTSCCRALSL